jgi:small nuclear ribonucleoprotein
MVENKRVKPLNILNQSINNRVIVELKAGREYRGILEGYDPHMNLVLKGVEELQKGEVKRTLSQTIVRGDNVIYISP